MPQPVSRFGRLLDAVGLLLFLAGASCYSIAFLGMRRLRDDKPMQARPGELWAGLAEWEQWRRLSWVGLAIVVAGVTVGIVSAMIHMRQRRGVARDNR